MAEPLKLLNPNNYITINLLNVKILGLYGAVYLNEVFDKMKKIEVVNTYQVTIDREDIAERLGISITDQKAVEDRWRIMHFMEPIEGFDNVFTVNVDTISKYLYAVYTEGLTKEEVKKIKDKFKNKNTEKDKELRKHKIAANIEAAIVCTNGDIKQKVFEWVEYILDVGRKLTIKNAQAFVDAINKYSGGDSTVAIKIIDLAINSAYINAEYAIRAYETSISHKSVNMSADFRRATPDNIVKGKKW